MTIVNNIIWGTFDFVWELIDRACGMICVLRALWGNNRQKCVMFKLAEWRPAGPGIIGVACQRIHTGSARMLTMQYDRCILVIQDKYCSFFVMSDALLALNAKPLKGSQALKQWQKMFFLPTMRSTWVIFEWEPGEWMSFYECDDDELRMRISVDNVQWPPGLLISTR